MSAGETQIYAENLVRDYVLEHLEKTDPVPEFQVFTVWFAYVLGNWKALISTTLPDGKYYEVTRNSTKQETYLDCYVKLDNVAYDGPYRD